jgi:hypothetical protein
MKTMRKSEKKKLRKKITDLEIANSALVNEQLYCSLDSYKRHKKLQRQIYKKEGWKAYTC